MKQFVIVTLGCIAALVFLTLRDVARSKMHNKTTGAEGLYYVFDGRGGKKQVDGISGIVTSNLKIVGLMYCILIFVMFFKNK